MPRPAIRLSTVVAAAPLAAAPGAAGDAPADATSAERSFREFAAAWLEGPGEAGAGPHAPTPLASRPGAASERTSYRTRGPRFWAEVRSTGDAAVPWVGVLRYVETVYECAGPGRTACAAVRQGTVTELFPYQDGRWRY